MARGRAKKDFKESQNRVLTLQSIPLPADVIADNHISAGWLLSQMDLAGGKRADDYIGGRAVTVGIDSMSFKKPVFVGDQVTIFTEIVRQGRSSVTMKVEAWAHRRRSKDFEKVTEGEFTFVAIDQDHKPVPITAPPPSWLPPAAGPGRSAAARPGPGDQPPPPEKLALRTIPLPRDVNYLGDIFGGWLLAHMDLAGAAAAQQYTGQRMPTVGVDAMTFHKRVRVGDTVSFYAEVVKTGNTSVTIKVETWAQRHDTGVHEKVTEGSFTYVAIDKNHQPIPVTPRP